MGVIKEKSKANFSVRSVWCRTHVQLLIEELLRSRYMIVSVLKNTQDNMDEVCETIQEKTKAGVTIIFMPGTNKWGVQFQGKNPSFCNTFKEVVEFISDDKDHSSKLK